MHRNDPRPRRTNGKGRFQIVPEANLSGPTAPAARRMDFAAAESPAGTDWLVWQLMDSAFPTGGFAHSLGMEAAWQHGEVSGRTELLAFAEASLDQLGHAALPFVTGVYDAPERLPELDRLCEVFTTNHVANRASRAQGRALLSAVERIFKMPPASGDDPNGALKMPALQFAHFAPVFGGCLQRLGLSRELTMRMFCFNHLRGVFAAAVRLNIIGPMEAQALQHQLGPAMTAMLTACQALPPEAVAQTAPLLDLWQGAQDRLYSRLFQS